MEQPYEVEHYPLHHNEAGAGRVGLTSYICDADHPLLLVAPTYVKTNVNAPALSQVRKRVQWHPRCTGYVPVDEEILAEALRLKVLQEEEDEEDQGGRQGELEQQDEPLPRQRSRRLAALQSEPLLASSPPKPPSSDPSWHPHDDAMSELDEEFDRANVKTGSASDNSSDEDDLMQHATPCSNDWLQDNNYSARLMARVHVRLQDPDVCLCGATRTFALCCHTEAQTEHLATALRSHLAAHVDPGAILPGESLVLTAQQYVNSPHVRNPTAGLPSLVHA
jgi:hypothetical protein